MSVKDTQSHFDQAKADAFAGKILTALNNGALCLMVSIGHRTGLFDVMSQSPPARSEEIAARAGLNERYVREWLGAMVTGGVVDFDPASNCYSLPAEHAAFLTRAAAADNMAVFAQYIAVMGCVEDDIVECFRKGGGVPYEKFPRFHEVMAEDSGQSVLSSLESHILPLVPGLTERLAKGIRVLDAGCGRGRILTRLAELYPRSRFVGMDLSREATGYARDKAAKARPKERRVHRRRSQRLRHHCRARGVRFRDDLRCDTRPGQAAQRAQGHSSDLEIRRRVSHAGHQRHEPRAQGHRTPDRDVPLHHLVHALHDGVAGARRRRSGRHVG